MKRAVDFGGSLMMLLILSPVFLIIMILIKFEDRGTAFFFQERLGRNGRIFKIYKFRSMIVNADRYVDEKGRPTKNRITRIGKIIRSSSLDELPQLINILKGEMSFVGPRPALPNQYYRYTDEQRERLSVLPGVTGLAQISGRNTLPWSQRIKLDIKYSQNISFFCDVKIILATAWQVIKRQDIMIDRNPDQVDDLGPPRKGVTLPGSNCSD